MSKTVWSICMPAGRVGDRVKYPMSNGVVLPLQRMNP